MIVDAVVLYAMRAKRENRAQHVEVIVWYVRDL